MKNNQKIKKKYIKKIKIKWKWYKKKEKYWDIIHWNSKYPSLNSVETNDGIAKYYLRNKKNVKEVYIGN